MIYKVLIADDEPIMRKAMQTLVDWESLGCQLVTVASSGQEVMDQLEKEIPDILILDIQMPGTNGLDIAQYVWKKKLPAKVILLTAYADFAYAQTAIKYEVVDYVIKTGAFEGLVAAIEKAKIRICDMESLQKEENQELLKENFFKSIFDGTLYQREDILAKADRLGLEIPSGWLAVAIRFRLKDDKKRDYVYQSLMNFLGMVFENQIIYGTAIKKNMIAVVLSVPSEEFSKEIYEKCLQVVEMMESFMKMHVYIGISSRGEDMQELKNACDEAEYAVEDGFFYETSKINYYEGPKREKKESLQIADAYLKELQYFIKKGKKEEALATFEKTLDCLKKSGSTTSTILDIGIEIQAWCRKFLAEFDKTLHDVVPYTRSIVQIIYQCKHVNEYKELMNTIIANTAEEINFAVGKKNIIIYEADKYIEENYKKNINVSEVSRELGVSLSYLSRIYKEGTGKTLIHSINEKKTEKAKEYLRNTDMKVYEIAEALGFENTTYFSYFFKKNTGMSPKDYKDGSGE